MANNVADNATSEPGQPARMRGDTLASSVVILLLATVLQRSIGFGRGILYCRWLSPEVLGQWEMAYSFLLLFAPLAVLGVPGSFGRYLEYYRQRGQLGLFIRRTTIWTAVCTVLAVGTFLTFPDKFSFVIFGEGESIDVVVAIGACVTAVILHHTLTSLLTAMRLFRVVSVMNFVQSLLFAVLTLSLLNEFPHVLTIVAGYGIACLIASVGTMLYVWPNRPREEAVVTDVPHWDFWKRLLKFAFFVWVTNLLSHLFAVVDRTMIIHCGNMSSTVALEQVGQYHSSRIVPLLLVSFADLLSGLIMPHLSRDWELGNRTAVSRNLNLTLKLCSLGMLCVGIGVLWCGPFLFGTILSGRYSSGLAVLPWTLVGCVLASLYAIAQTYLWCAEHARLATLPIALGLVINIGLNLVCVPLWGLWGAVIATAISTGVGLVVLFGLSARHGMELDRGLWLVAFSVVSLGFGSAAATLTFLLLAVPAATTSWILNDSERGKLWEVTRSWAESAKRFLPGRSYAPSTPS